MGAKTNRKSFLRGHHKKGTKNGKTCKLKTRTTRTSLRQVKNRDELRKGKLFLLHTRHPSYHHLLETKWYDMKKERTGLRLRHTEHIRGHSVTVGSSVIWCTLNDRYCMTDIIMNKSISMSNSLIINAQTNIIIQKDENYET